MNREIPIFYACDDNFVKFTMVSAQSMMDNADPNRKYHIHVLHAGVSDEMYAAMMAMERENFKISFDDVTDYLRSINDKLPLRDYYTRTTYFRLFIAEMFPQYDKAIYIDSDTIVLGDISKMYDYDLKENYVGACNEQAMVQNDHYGTYVEKVVGVNRYEYFNAGVLLLNCRLFRAHKLLDKFVRLLHEVVFAVTQDEDYLNAICKDRVLWLPQGWNTEMFGKLPVTEDEMYVVHYIMVSKPWHYTDCRMQEKFWHYADKTSVAPLIHAILDNYTDEERRRDEESAVCLEQLAIDEVAKVDERRFA